MKIGLFFGSFNPVHNGHLMVASYVANHSDMNQVWLVVSPQNPLKPQGSLLNEYDRLHLTKLAIEDDTQLKVSDIEFSLPKPSYTIDTLTYLQEKYPQHEFSVIMGADSFLQLYTWNDWRDLSRYIHLAVASRPPYSIQKQLTDHPPLQDYYLDHQTKLAHDLCSKASGLIYLDEQLSIDLASSSLRPLLSSNNTANRIQEWLPKSIHALILKKGLYQSTR